ncbi:hypothetical protein CAP47_02970 [Psychroflexus sp. S27]|uniref:DUF7935 family protein n=1 Tax=Psychroflexus sp. S27 TaxID=1982757 RepID=UPI000C2A6DEA|nr:hypothetical protein [Psychroflexus sp. S27]PJX24469.1 hypothetical protein CAP47_02970 [Psychroflexus sp. S27]
MDNYDSILTILIYLLPTLVVGAVAYYFFKTHTDHLAQLKYNEDLNELKKESLPVRLQAFERLTLFLERIHPGNLLQRVNPTSEDKHTYEQLLVATIEQEYEHNLIQQIYVSNKTWQAIRASKGATISLIRQINMNEKITTAQKLREAVLTELLDKQSPSETGLEFLKNEAQQLW